MTYLSEVSRFLLGKPPAHLKRPASRLQPILAKEGKPNIDLPRLREKLKGDCEILPLISVQSPSHWEEIVLGLDDSIDGILPVSIPAYPTEVWNSHPQPLVMRGLPFIFWCLVELDEPDFWRWSARDFLKTLGVEVYLVKDHREGAALVKSLAMRRFLKNSKIVVFGEQNFPWNANAAGHIVTQNLGTQIVVRSLEDFRSRYGKYSRERLEQEWQSRKSDRYVLRDAHSTELGTALRTSLAIGEVLEEERALGFGVNCFGDLIIKGGRDVPCLAQCFLRENGYIASCDGDFIAMMSMVLATFYLDKPCMMSNMYPLHYAGAITDHFGDPLLPDDKIGRERWKNMARLNHCGYVGVISPEMSPDGKAMLREWGGTNEIKRDGRGCGIDADLAPGEPITVVELCFDAKRLLVASAKVVETTRHQGMPHCESTALLEFHDLEGFVANISREHTVIVYGDHIQDFQVLAGVLGLECHTY